MNERRRGKGEGGKGEGGRDRRRPRAAAPRRAQPRAAKKGRAGKQRPAAIPVGATAWRHHALVFGFLAALVALAVRTAYLSVTERDFLKEQGEVRSVREVTIPVHRGMIFDRHGAPLAVSAPMNHVWTDPELDHWTTADLHRLGNALGVETAVLQRRLDAGSRRFASLARRLAPDVAQQVAELGIAGARIGRSYHRFYPAGETTAHVVGRTNVDDVGQEGIELALDEFLTGEPGRRRVLYDNKGRVIKDLDFLRPPTAGEDVHLSLDLRLQYLAYRDLKAAVERHGATSGSLVMLDAASGEVLALANQPSFNPNAWRRRGVQGVRNRAIADVYEPGSTVKPLSVLAALEAGAYTAESEIDTAPGYFPVGAKLIEDPVNRGRITVAQVLAKSSQVGIAKMALSLREEEAIFRVFQRAGFGDYTGCALPGEAVGMLSSADLDKPIGRATLAYGYGLTVSPMQLARAYLILANDGVKMDVTVLAGDDTGRGERVFRRRDVQSVASMMRGVLAPDGTAPKGRPPGYTAAGKTGTVRKVSAAGYSDRSHVAFFAGFAPAERPRIVLVVVINEPRSGPIGGGTVAAPVFARVAERTLRLLGVAPDHPEAAQPPGRVARSPDDPSRGPA